MLMYCRERRYFRNPVSMLRYRSYRTDFNVGHNGYRQHRRDTFCAELTQLMAVHHFMY